MSSNTTTESAYFKNKLAEMETSLKKRIECPPGTEERFYLTTFVGGTARIIKWANTSEEILTAFKLAWEGGARSLRVNSAAAIEIAGKFYKVNKYPIPLVPLKDKVKEEPKPFIQDETS